MAGESECSFKRVRVRLQLLCCLGLEGPAVIVALLRELSALVFSGRNHFLWLDEQHQPCQFCKLPPRIPPRVSGFFLGLVAR